jgi:uncharacterized protein (DUF2141 family)
MGSRLLLAVIEDPGAMGAYGMNTPCAGLISALLFAIVARTGFPQNRPDKGIRVHVEALHSDRGQVVCALFAAPEYFPKRIDRAFGRTTAHILEGHATCDFPNVPAGTYAISVFHDENGNGKLDTNWLGIPREGVGASNNPKPRMGPPKFAAAEFHYSGGSLNLAITMHYL